MRGCVSTPLGYPLRLYVYPLRLYVYPLRLYTAAFTRPDPQPQPRPSPPTLAVALALTRRRYTAAISALSAAG